LGSEDFAFFRFFFFEKSMHDERPLKIIGLMASVKSVCPRRWNVSDVGIRSNLGRVEDRLGWLTGSTTMPDDRLYCLIESCSRSSENNKSKLLTAGAWAHLL
jgi:hypothetical protein